MTDHAPGDALDDQTDVRLDVAHDGHESVGVVERPEAAVPPVDPRDPIAPPADPGAAAFEPAAMRADAPATASPAIGALSLLHDVDMEVTVELGRTTMPIRELLSLQPGMVVEIERDAGAPIDVLVNGRLIACGEVVVIDEEFGIRITEIAAPREP